MSWRNQRQDFVVSSLSGRKFWGIVTQLLIVVPEQLLATFRKKLSNSDRSKHTPPWKYNTRPRTTFFLSLSSYNPFRNMTTKDILTSPVYSLPTTHVTHNKHRKTQFKDWNLLFSQMFEVNSPKVLISS